MSEATPGSPSQAQNRGTSSTRILFFVLAVGLLLVVVMGFLRWKQIDAIEQRLADVSEGTALQMGIVARELRAVAGRAEEAYLKASQAERDALEAADKRAQAEAARAVAEREVQGLRSQAERERHKAEAARAEAARVRQEQEEELNRLHQAWGQIAETRRTALGLVMSLGSDSMQFDFDKADLRPANRELLSKIVGILLTSKSYGIYVYGHTDDVGTEEYNRDLSARRARAVRDYLVQGGIDANRITTQGFGKSRPIVPEKSPEARAKNRRVEIGIVETAIGYKKAQSPE